MRTLRLEELGVNGLGEVDEPAFSGLAERHRRELHVHCYRMLGSFEDAEDTVQETFLRAWRRRETFEGRSTFRAWLYRIATNACLDLLAKRRPEPATGGEVLWLQPYPDRLLDELPAGDADEPETVAVARETIELAYLVAVQHLAPRPRAVLILRDVLGWPAKDVADLLGDSVNSVNSALQRARAGMREHLPAERQDWTGGEEDAGTRELVRRFTDASVATDVDGLAAMLRDDVRCSMPPTPGLYVGRDAVVNDWVEDGFEGMGGLRAVLTSVNRQPAIAFYLWQEQEGAYLPLTLDVLRITGGAIAEIATFHDDQFPRLGLPERLPADGTEAGATHGPVAQARHRAGPATPHRTRRARRHRPRGHTRGDGGHHARRCTRPGRRRRLRGPRRRRDDPVVRVRRGDRLLLGRGRRHRRRASSLERSARRPIRVDGGVADRDLAGPARALRGGHRHHRRSGRATPRRGSGDDPEPDAEPPLPSVGGREAVAGEHMLAEQLTRRQQPAPLGPGQADVAVGAVVGEPQIRDSPGELWSRAAPRPGRSRPRGQRGRSRDDGEVVPLERDARGEARGRAEPVGLPPHHPARTQHHEGVAGHLLQLRLRLSRQPVARGDGQQQRLGEEAAPSAPRGCVAGAR